MATTKGPGKSYRKGISLIQATKMFDTEEKAEAWFIEQRWPNGVACPHCGSTNIAEIANRKPQPFRCRDCRKHFSVKSGTLLHSSKIPLSKWAIAFYLFSTSLKGVSSMKLHRDLEISQKAAWYMAHRIRGMWDAQTEKFAGPVEADETFVGGKQKNMHSNKRIKGAKGTVGKAVVVGVRDRATNHVAASHVSGTDKPTIQAFVENHIEDGAKVYSDEHPAYNDLPNHEYVRHSVKQYVAGQIHTNGMESFWAGLKRGYVGVYHHMSPKHLERYVAEFAGRHNARPLDTGDQMTALARGADGKRVTYTELTA